MIFAAAVTLWLWGLFFILGLPQLCRQLNHMEKLIMSTQDQLDALAADMAAAATQTEKANAEILAEIQKLESSVNSGDEADFTAVYAALDRQKAASQSLDDIVPDAAVSLPGDAEIETPDPETDAGTDTENPAVETEVEPGFGKPAEKKKWFK